MDTQSAAKYCIPFGRHKGKPLEAVLFADPSYLTYMQRTFDLRNPAFKHAFETFMADPATKKTLDERILDEKHARQNWR